MEGRRLADRYLLKSLLGRGGMGSVWRASHLELGIDVAVKLMDPSLAELPNGLARFRREAQAAASLKSPNVVQVFDYGIDDGTPYIAMELLQGESLGHRISRTGRLSLTETAKILTQVARALGKAHEAGIVHRDLKPENIFLVFDEEIEIAKVLDFGIAKLENNDDLGAEGVKTRTGVLLGSPYYMSPEQAAGLRDIDYRTDIWAFGVIAFECIVGRRVFNHDNIGGLVLAICTEPMVVPSQVSDVPSGFDAWFARCVARHRRERFQSIREASHALARLDPLQLAPISAEYTPTRTAKPSATVLDEVSAPTSGTGAAATSITLSRTFRTMPSRRLSSVLALFGVLSTAIAVYAGYRHFAPHTPPLSNQKAPSEPHPQSPLAPTTPVSAIAMPTKERQTAHDVAPQPSQPAATSVRRPRPFFVRQHPLPRAEPDATASTKPVDLAF